MTDSHRVHGCKHSALTQCKSTLFCPENFPCHCLGSLKPEVLSRLQIRLKVWDIYIAQPHHQLFGYYWKP